MFPRTLETFRDVLHDNAVVVIEGRLSIREDEPARLVAESISPIEGYNPARPQDNRPNQMRDVPGGSRPATLPHQPGVRQGGQSAGDF